MDVSPQDLRAVQLREAWRGYRHDDVDQLLDRVAGTIERLQGQVQRLSERLAEAENEAGLGREADEMLRRTLLLAQRTADAAVGEAQERARRVLSESEAHAHSIVSGAEEEARRIAIAERQRVENEIQELSARREVLIADVEALEQAANDHRRRLRTFLEAELARIDARPLPEPALATPSQPPPPPAPEPAPERAEPLPDEPSVAPPLEHVDLTGDPGDLLPAARKRRWRLRDDDDLDPDPPSDSFFDELRQAVRDDTPLGPRDQPPDEPEPPPDPPEELANHASGFFDQDES